MTMRRTGAPHEPPIYDDQTIAAIRALYTGTANEGQQVRAWNWIVYFAAGYHDLSYRPGGEDGRRASDFMEGRRFVGAQMLKLLQPALTPRTPEPPKTKGKR
jgi:hypothetical protein